jgi:CHASE3 domain sensor protein
MRFANRGAAKRARVRSASASRVIVRFEPAVFAAMSLPVRSRALILSRPAVIAVLAAAFALILGAGLLAELSTQEVAAAEQHAAHVQQTHAAVSEFLGTMADAEIATRSAVLTREANAPAALAGIAAHARTQIATLRGHLNGGGDVSPAFAQLQQLTDARFAELAQALEVLRERGSLPALNVLEANNAARTAEEIRRAIAALQRQELADFAGRSAQAATRARAMQALDAGLIVLAAALAAAVAWWLVQRIRDREGMITVCAWTRRVQWQGRWVSFEEYLSNRFDLRCTHGICDEVAEQIKREVADAPPPPELRRGAGALDGLPPIGRVSDT